MKALSTALTLTLLCGCATTDAQVGSTAGQPTRAATPSPDRPAFSWDTVPLYGHLGKTSGDFTPEEARFIADTYDFVAIEKGHATATRGDTEAGTSYAVSQLRALNPNLRVLFYWNGFIEYQMYAATRDRRPDAWYLRTSSGEYDVLRGDVRRYDLSNQDFRRWWVDTAVAAVDRTGAQGIFIDALPQVAGNPAGLAERVGAEKAEALRSGSEVMMAELQRRLGPTRTIIYNGLRTSLPWPDGGARYQPWTTGAMVEHFGFLGSADKEHIARDIALIQVSDARGEVVVVKGWPTFSWLDTEVMKQPEDTLYRRAIAEIEFPLAAFLMAAGEHTYFSYSWGYREQHGQLRGYPEFKRRLGSPRGPARRDGWTYSREFQHASVKVNLEAKTADISWKS